MIRVSNTGVSPAGSRCTSTSRNAWYRPATSRAAAAFSCAAYTFSARVRALAASAARNCSYPSSAKWICLLAIAFRKAIRPGHSNVCRTVTDQATPSPEAPGATERLLPAVPATSGFAHAPALCNSPRAAAISAL